MPGIELLFRTKPRRRISFFLAVLLLHALAFGTLATADKAAYLDLARRGWNYELRTHAVGRAGVVPVHINGRDLAGARLCVLGEKPHPESVAVLEAFSALLEHVFEKRSTVFYAGTDPEACTTEPFVILRLYSGYPPEQALTSDMNWMNAVFELGLPKGRNYAVFSPAMAQTFFGRLGQVTHLMVMQPARRNLDRLERDFFRSLLIEELFQSFTFGMDVLHINLRAGFLSKLQEIPMNLTRLPWQSRSFKRALLESNPKGLCTFDLFMLHAVARAPVDQTVHPEFLSYIDTAYDDLQAAAKQTMADHRFNNLIDFKCGQS